MIATTDAELADIARQDWIRHRIEAVWARREWWQRFRLHLGHARLAAGMLRRVASREFQRAPFAYGAVLLYGGLILGHALGAAAARRSAGGE